MAYENITFDIILSRLMSRVIGNVDKREGSLIYNALAPAAAELQQMYIELDVVLNETFAEDASREYLIKRCAERGITPIAATSAVFKGVFNINVPIGSRFTSSFGVFAVTELIEPFTFRLEAETPGALANQSLGTIVPVEYIDGLTSAELTELLIPGADEEETEALRQRYFNSFSSQAFGGNRADYIEKVNKLPGVGGSKASRTPSGGGTVGVVIIDSTFGVPSPTLIDDVQTALDPTVNTGEGLGIAPIGHLVTVTGVTEVTVDISTTITFAPGWDWAALKPYFDAVIDEYFLELKQNWEDEAQIIVRIAQIESRVLNLTGVVDIAGTTLNGLAVNLVLSATEIPKRGTTNG